MEAQEGQKLAAKEGLMFFELSAKTNLNLKKVFFSVVAELPFFEQFDQMKEKVVNELGKKLYLIY